MKTFRVKGKLGYVPVDCCVKAATENEAIAKVYIKMAEVNTLEACELDGDQDPAKTTFVIHPAAELAKEIHCILVENGIFQAEEITQADVFLTIISRDSNSVTDLYAYMDDLTQSVEGLELSRACKLMQQLELVAPRPDPDPSETVLLLGSTANPDEVQEGDKFLYLRHSFNGVKYFCLDAVTKKKLYAGWMECIESENTNDVTSTLLALYGETPPLVVAFFDPDFINDIKIDMVAVQNLDTLAELEGGDFYLKALSGEGDSGGDAEAI